MATSLVVRALRVAGLALAGLGVIGSGVAAAGTNTQSPTFRHIPIRTVDFRNSTIPILASEVCPAASIKMRRSSVAVVNGIYYRILLGSYRPIYGDVDRDGREDAVIRVDCAPRTEYSSAVLAIKTVGQRLVPIGWVTPQVHNYEQVTPNNVTRGVINVLHQREMAGQKPRDTEYYKWNGSKFVRVG